MAIITAVLAFLGPLLNELFKDCAKERAEKAAEKLPAPETFASEGEYRDAVFDQMLADLRPWERRKRNAIRRAKAVAAKHNVTSQGAMPLAADDAEELADLVAAIE